MRVLATFSTEVPAYDATRITEALKTLAPAFTVVERPLFTNTFEFLQSMGPREYGVSVFELGIFEGGTVLFETGNLTKDGDIESVLINLLNRRDQWELEISINCRTSTDGYRARIRPILDRVMGINVVLI